MKTYMSSREYFGLGKVPVGIGAVLRGWDISEEHFRDPKRLGVVDFRAMFPECQCDCLTCFVKEGKSGCQAEKVELTLTISTIECVIDQIIDAGAHSIDFLGEGEPTLDPDYRRIIAHTACKSPRREVFSGITPVVFTNGIRCAGLSFAVAHMKMGDGKVSVVLKCDSLYDAAYQNWMAGVSFDYFGLRNQALESLMKAGLNNVTHMSEAATRLGILMVVSSRNIHEVPDTLRFCREHNIWIVFSFFLPTGKTGREDFDQSLIPEDWTKDYMRRQIAKIDREEFGFDHPVYSNFATTPCVERMQIKGNGDVTPCPGNDTVIGNVRDHSIRDLHEMILAYFPKHNPTCFDGHCLYRPRIPEGQ